jgi:hypothetical protein
MHHVERPLQVMMMMVDMVASDRPREEWSRSTPRVVSPIRDCGRHDMEINEMPPRASTPAPLRLSHA